MKKFITVITTISILLLTSCSNDDDNTSITKDFDNTNTTLEDRAIELAMKMDMLAGDEIYFDSLTAIDEVNYIIQSIASQDYSNPTDIYKLSGIDKSYKTVMNYIGSPVPTFENQAVEQIYKERVIASLPLQINSMSGANMIAGTSLLAIDDVFLYDNLTESEVYLLLYDGDYHVTVLFTPKGEGIVTADANIVAHQMLNQIQVDGDISGSMKLGISFAGISLEKITD